MSMSCYEENLSRLGIQSGHIINDNKIPNTTGTFPFIHCK